jgi:hypothetical protein
LFAALAGCSADSPKDLGTIEPTSASVGPEQSEQFVQRARKLYSDYLAVTQQIAEKGSKDFRRLRPLLSSKAYETEVNAFKSQEARGLRTTGPSELIRFRAQNVEERAGVIVAYACIDVSKVRVVDKSGKDVTPASRPDRQTFLPSFVTEDGRLVLGENGTWSGASIC